MGALRDKNARSLNKVLRSDLRKTSKQAKYAKRVAKAKAQGTFKDGVGTYTKGGILGFGKRTATIDATGKATKKNIFKQGYIGLTKGLRRNDGSMKSFKKGFKKHMGIITHRKDGKRRSLNPWRWGRSKKNKNSKK